MSEAKANEATSPVLKHSEVVFMYGSDAKTYRDYGATFLGWGHAYNAASVEKHHQMGIRCTATIWCLTAGAKLIHDDPALADAVARDIEGHPVLVPWLFDNVYEGTRAYFGCTNHPAFRALNRKLARDAMTGGADGLHIDDPRGVAAAWALAGGGFCDHCMTAFREWLRSNASETELREAGVTDLDTFDYRDLVRRHAATREEYLAVREQIPLNALFGRFHDEAAADNVAGIAREATEAAGRKILISANAYRVEPAYDRIVKLDAITHVICEVPHHADHGTEKIEDALEAYQRAEKLGKPVATTGSGHDWAWVKAHASVNLVKIWVALAYAHGQRFMAPARQWCFTTFLGTHWYQAPADEFSPIYQWIRAEAQYFDGFEAMDDSAIECPPKVLCRARRNAQGQIVLHVINTDYVPRDDAVKAIDILRRPERTTISFPSAWAHQGGEAKVLSYNARPHLLPLGGNKDRTTFSLADLHVWTMIVLP